jgi:hypothetical protein
MGVGFREFGPIGVVRKSRVSGSSFGGDHYWGGNQATGRTDASEGLGPRLATCEAVERAGELRSSVYGPLRLL